MNDVVLCLFEFHVRSPFLFITKYTKNYLVMIQYNDIEFTWDNVPIRAVNSYYDSRNPPINYFTTVSPMTAQFIIA